jgi:hypothetical protein
MQCNIAAVNSVARHRCRNLRVPGSSGKNRVKLLLGFELDQNTRVKSVS